MASKVSAKRSGKENLPIQSSKPKSKSSTTNNIKSSSSSSKRPTTVGGGGGGGADISIILDEDDEEDPLAVGSGSAEEDDDLEEGSKKVSTKSKATTVAVGKKRIPTTSTFGGKKSTSKRIVSGTGTGQLTTTTAAGRPRSKIVEESDGDGDGHGDEDMPLVNSKIEQEEEGEEEGVGFEKQMNEFKDDEEEEEGFGSGLGGGEDQLELKRKLTKSEKEVIALKNSLARITQERDSSLKQFSELVKVTSEVDKDFEKRVGEERESWEGRAKAQDQLINSLESLKDNLTSKITKLETALKSGGGVAQGHRQGQVEAGPSIGSSGSGDQEVKELREMIGEMQKKLSLKEGEFKTLQQDYKAEIDFAKKQKQTSSNHNPKQANESGGSDQNLASAEEREKDQFTMSLYEDLTNFMVRSVKVKEGGCGKEVTFVCVQTIQGKSLTFRLKSYNVWSEDKSKPQGGFYIKNIKYEPIDLDKEMDRSFVEGLGMFKGSFFFPRDQTSEFLNGLRDCMSPEESEE